MSSETHLLALPRELRDAIYESIALQRPICLRCDVFVYRDRSFISAAVTTRVCKQLHEDSSYVIQTMTLSPRYLSTIRARVNNTHFAPCSSVLASLSPADRHIISTRLLVELFFCRRSSVRDRRPRADELDPDLLRYGYFGQRIWSQSARSGSGGRVRCFRVAIRGCLPRSARRSEGRVDEDATRDGGASVGQWLTRSSKRHRVDVG